MVFPMTMWPGVPILKQATLPAVYHQPWKLGFRWRCRVDCIRGMVCFMFHPMFMVSTSPSLINNFLGRNMSGPNMGQHLISCVLFCFLKAICFFPICWPTSAGASMILICSFCGLETSKSSYRSNLGHHPLESKHLFFNRKHPYCHQVKSSYVFWIIES